jgi:tRNA threonylcarbamoyladenosine biosynthesis protein TsaB
MMAYGFFKKHIFENHPLTAGAWLCPMIDARRLEVYTAFFDHQNNYKVDAKAEIIDEQSFADILSLRPVYFFGNGSGKCKDIIKHPNARFDEGFFPSAKDMIILSEQLFKQSKFVDVAYFEPFYLKDFLATVAKSKVIK